MTWQSSLARWVRWLRERERVERWLELEALGKALQSAARSGALEDEANAIAQKLQALQSAARSGALEWDEANAIAQKLRAYARAHRKSRGQLVYMGDNDRGQSYEVVR